MLQILFSWIVMGIASFLFGKVIVDTVYRNNLAVMGKLDIYVVTGLIFLNVYAQTFSIFYKVAGVACTILGILGIAAVAGYGFYLVKKKQKVSLGRLKAGWKKYHIIIIILCCIATMVWTNEIPGQYDTGLYHAQAIHWIEEYGVVKGLGNLHMRFAYNSAFMSLQALFSLEWLVGQSLHTLNGYFCLTGLLYALLTIRVVGSDSWKISDLLKAVMIIYIVQNRYDISSSGTDIWAMLLVFYVFIKWSESAEKDIKTVDIYCFLSLVGAYALTVKLSAAAVVILVLYPAVLLIKNKDIKKIMGNIVGGFAIVAPFLIRNVIISGYLIYPYPSLDLFQVDWKMNPEVVRKDAEDITIWGRSRVGEYTDAVWNWLPKWFMAQSMGNRILLLAGLLAVFICIWYIVQCARKKMGRETILFIAGIACLLVWLIGAPLMRYGIAYLYVVIALAIGAIPFRHRGKILSIIAAVVLIPMLCMYLTGVVKVGTYEQKRWIKQHEYIPRAATQYEVGNQSIWFPDEGDMMGYETFPGTPVKSQLDTLELRGTDLKDGFRTVMGK